MLGHGGIVVFDDSVDMARQARFAFEFCAKESCGKCTPCRIGSTRGVETVDKIIAGRDRAENVATAARSLRDADRRLALRARRPDAAAGPKRARPFQRGFRAPRRAHRGGIGDAPMALLQELDTGTPIRAGEATVTLTIDGRQVSVPPGTSVMAAAALIDNPIPKLCATDSLEAFGSCRLCLVEIEGRKGTPASCTTPAEAGMIVRTQTPRLAKLRRGVMELYISDHPLDCLTCSANGDCELQAQAGVVGLRDVRYGYDGANHLKAPTDASNPYFTFESSKCIVCSRCVRACEEVQGTFALTILGRGFDSKVSPGGVDFCRSECVSCGACVQACPTATLNEKSVIEKGTPERSVVTTCAYCGVGCSFKAEMKGDEVVRMVPYKAGKANEGHSCVKGRFAYGYATHKDRILQADDPRPDRGSLARSLVGRGDRLRRERVQAHPGQVRPRLGRRDHLLALHQRGSVPGPEAGARRLRQQQRRHLRARLPFADRLRTQPDLRHFGRHAGFQVGREVRRRSSSSAPIRPTRIRFSPRA